MRLLPPGLVWSGIAAPPTVIAEYVQVPVFQSPVGAVSRVSIRPLLLPRV